MDIIYFNAEIGDILRTFRKSYDKTAASVANVINKKAPYLSKLESGQVKKITAIDFIKICNYITDSEHGIEFFIDTAFNKNDIDYTDETFITLINIDEVLYQFPTPSELVNHLSHYIKENNIDVRDIASELNANKDLSKLPQETLKNMIPNLWYNNSNDHGCSIKLEIPESQIIDFFNGKLSNTNYVFLEALVYTIYRLNNISPETAHKNTNDTLKEHHIFKLRATRHITNKNLSEVFGDLEPQVEKDFNAVLEALRFILFVSQNKGGNKRISTIKHNLEKDLGYTFAFISTDISTICDLSYEKKKAFLKDLKSLVDQYSSYKETDIDLFLDE